jgi:hypothetical protein
VSKQIKLTSSDFYSTEDLIPEAVLDENDPVIDIQRLAGLSDANQGSLKEYSGYNTVAKTEVSNVSHTANEKIQYQQQNNIQPGTPEWFRLWFSLPYLTGEKPF